MSDEKIKILKMIEEGKITAAEGAMLLQALDEGAASATAAPSTDPPRWFRVQVTNTETGASLVNVTIPMGMVMTGIRMGAQFAPNIEQQKLVQAVRAAEQGKRGKLIDYTDSSRTERVEIYAE